ncbi:MAG: glycosyltransferase family 9 protein [Nitrospinota bacterium]|nr:glycosyltransferase family 9 protein [Nitrospinota bacterium]
MLTIKLLMILKKYYPESVISMGATPNHAIPLLESDLVSQIVDATRRPFHLFETPYSPEDDLTKELKKYDMMIVFKKDENGMIRNRLEKMGTKNFVIQSPFPPKKSKLHVSKWLERAVIKLNQNEPNEIQDIKLTIPDSTLVLSELEIKKNQLKSPFLSIHPGSGSKKKCAPINIIIKIAKQIVSLHDLQPVLIEGVTDESICNEFRRNWGSEIIKIKINSLKILAGILIKSRGYLGCDSGISHLSSLYGVPTLVLFGPYSNPIQWGPIGNKSYWTYWDEKKCKKTLNNLFGSQNN